MAIAYPTSPDHGEDNFVLELRRVREEIKQKFIIYIDCVKARECELLEELDIILASYHSYRDEVQNQNKSKRILEESKNLSEEQLQKSPINEFQKDIIKLTENEINSIMSPAEPKMVYFVCDKMFTELNKLGKLVENVRLGVDYKRKVHPVVVFVREDMEWNNYNPWGVTVDNRTGNIYVADWGTHCVKVFDSSGTILFKFGDSDGEGKMLHPRGLVISEDRILISNYDYLKSNHNILIYLLNGDFVSKIGKYGDGKIEFYFPRGIACNESNGDIHICDCNNNRIQILSKELQFKFQFGADKLKHPLDVKLSKENIFILDESNPCIHMYDLNLILQKSVISRGIGMQVVKPFYFFIDDSNNIIISDSRSNSINVFNPEFELIHKIDTSPDPVGVVINNQERILVVCRADKGCLQIF